MLDVGRGMIGEGVEEWKTGKITLL